MKKAEKAEITGKKVFILISLITVLVLFSSPLIRLANERPVLSGEEPYFHARIARQIAETSTAEEDKEVYSSRHNIFSPYHYFISGFSVVMNPLSALFLTAALFGLLSVWLFYQILKEMQFKLLGRVCIMLVFVLSPVFIHSFIVPSPNSAIVFLDLLAIFCFARKERYFFWMALICFLLASLLSPINLIMMVFIILFYSRLCSQKKKRQAKAIISLLIMVLIFFYVRIRVIRRILTPPLIKTNLLQQFVSDFGGIFGFSIFALLLSAFGIVFIWRRKKRFHYLYMFIIALIVVSFFYNSFVLYSNFAICILAGIALSYFIQKRWSLKQIRNLSILLIFLGLLFSSVSFISRESTGPPSKELVNSLTWLRDNSDKGDVVFSHYSKGLWVEYFAERRVLIDSRFDGIAEAGAKFNHSQTIFYEWDIRKTSRLLKSYNVSYILITEDMHKGLVWEEPQKGLEFLLNNNETFKKIFSNSEIGIWEFLTDQSWEEND